MVNNKKINYETLRTTTDAIFTGTCYIDTLSLERSKAALKAVEEMSKHPFSSAQMREQVQRNKEMLRNRKNF